ncbi:MAG: hypothetical protein RL367_1525, partial [Pseudomonadota bacterium]
MFQYPGRVEQPQARLANVNLILGDNGGGKSSVLRALTVAILASVLPSTGFIAHRLVRRNRKGMAPAEQAELKVKIAPTGTVYFPELPTSLAAMIASRQKGNIDILEPVPASIASWPGEALYDDDSPAFFLVGYGATRRVETSDFSESSSRRSRGLRYQRVAGLFEDHLAMRPLQSWFHRLDYDHPRKHEVIAQLQLCLPEQLIFTGQRDEEDQYLFEFEGIETPLSGLSDGYKAFVGWVSDLISHIVDVAPQMKLDALPGIVMVDEIDLHLHPEWQRSVVPRLAAAFPNLQFIFTSHSPLVASTVERYNVFVTDR